MYSSCGKQKRAEGERSSSSEYPSAWSEWQWDEAGDRWQCYRLNGPDDYEFDYHSPSEGGQSASQSSQPVNERAPQSYLQLVSQNYTTPPVYGAATDTTKTEHQEKSGDEIKLTLWNRIATSNPNTSYEQFNKKYKVHPSKEFRWGRAFKILWSPPKTSEEAEDSDYTSSGSTTEGEFKNGKARFHKVRRFLILSKQEGDCICLPITTYGRKGIAKTGVHIEDHAEIYSGKSPVYAAGKKGLTKHPIKLSCFEGHKLVEGSLLNYAKVYTMEHNVKVCFIGQIDEKSQWHVAINYNYTHPPPCKAPGQEPPQDADHGPPDFMLLEKPAEQLYKWPSKEDSVIVYASSVAYIINCLDKAVKRRSNLFPP